MEKVETHCIQQEQIKHTITCDICGKLIATEIEFYDGYYSDHVYEISLPAYSLIYSKQLCPECIKKVNIDFIEMLKKFGFESKK